MAAAVEVRGLVNRFGRQTVHRDLDMSVEEGEVFGIVGGSGSGKSVLLRTILGLQKPNAGSVSLHGRDITSMNAAELRAAKAGYGVTFQQGALFSSPAVAAPHDRRTGDAEAQVGGAGRRRGAQVSIATLRRHGQTRGVGTRAGARSEAVVPR